MIASFKMTPKSSEFATSILNYFKNKKMCAQSYKNRAVHSVLLPANVHAQKCMRKHGRANVHAQMYMRKCYMHKCYMHKSTCAKMNAHAQMWVRNVSCASVANPFQVI